jgi:hypothetical protein
MDVLTIFSKCEKHPPAWHCELVLQTGVVHFAVNWLQGMSWWLDHLQALLRRYEDINLQLQDTRYFMSFPTLF